MKKLKHLLTSLLIVALSACNANSNEPSSEQISESLSQDSVVSENSSSEESIDSSTGETQTPSESESVEDSSSEPSEIPDEPVEPKEINLLGENYENCLDIATAENGTVYNFNERYYDKYGFLDQRFATDEVTYVNNEIYEGPVTVGENDDVKHIFYNFEGYARFVSRADGYAFTIPTNTTLETDFSIGKYRSKLYNEEFTLTISYEHGNTYNNWQTYRHEWLFGYLDNDEYLEQNNLSLTRERKVNDTKTMRGYTIDQYDLVINDPLQIKKYYYNIAAIRETTDIKNFILLVMKSTVDNTNVFDDIISTYTRVPKEGTANNNSLNNLPANGNPNWNQETKDYYELLKSQQETGWGAFTANLPEGRFTPNNIKNTTIYKKNEALQEALDYNFKIIPTYQHLGWGTRDRFTKNAWPAFSSALLAGGNGFNDKPVVQMSYQFTINNNNVSVDNKGESLYTPMFDLYRGSYGDDIKYFTEANNVYVTTMKNLAKDIKAYGKPVLFRLNNEMNTDWTSYCGMMTLLDPYIFQATWRVIYNIFEQEGVDNCIWIFNPFDGSFPYCSWGEDLCYYPGVDYVQALGLTAYKDNNSNNVNSTTFRNDYTALYNKNNAMWNQYPWIISEFGCGAGGDASGVRYRNQASQVNYINGMFNDFANRENNPYLQNIKGAIWFSVNDYSDDNKVANQYELEIEKLPNTIQALKEGLAKSSSSTKEEE